MEEFLKKLDGFIEAKKSSESVDREEAEKVQKLFMELTTRAKEKNVAVVVSDEEGADACKIIPSGKVFLSNGKDPAGKWKWMSVSLEGKDVGQIMLKHLCPPGGRFFGIILDAVRNKAEPQVL